MRVIASEKVPIKMWLEDIEEGAEAQAKNLANLPFVFKHVAIMPDCHQGYGMPIGGVLTTRGVVIPNAVGVDIGCGMCAVKTSLLHISKDFLEKLVFKIQRVIPVGFNHQKDAQDNDLMPCTDGLHFYHSIVGQQYESALHQLGTLGGGNHFIEIQKGSDDCIWIMIHSGSRNLGKKVADHYNKLAVELNERWYSSIPKSWELAFLPMDTPEYKEYMTEMKYCVAFAFANRKLMMGRIQNIFQELFPYVSFGFMINIAHNYARMEHHYGENVLVHRKGATFAGEDNTGIIPGSQGTKSYIVKGKGNKESFNSCSHGAGRCMGRKQATRELNLEEEIKRLDDQGIVHGIREVADLDEATGAYKDIKDVMAQQSDLVEILHELTPLAVIKG